MGEDVFSKLLSVKIINLPDIGVQRANFQRCARNRKPKRGGLMDGAQKMAEKNLFLHGIIMRYGNRGNGGREFLLYWKWHGGH
ncbi:MAG: hypothetical protein AB7D27_00545 [Desulfomicrobium sp.]